MFNLDEGFVRAAHVHESTAQTRWLEATWRRREAESTPRTPAPGVSWTVRPSRHLKALRPSSVWLLCGLLTVAAGCRSPSACCTDPILRKSGSGPAPPARRTRWTRHVAETRAA
jgi:hypothetical protein